MPSIDDVKAAVQAAADSVKTAVTDSVAKETAEIVAQIQALKGQSSVSQADLDALVASVQGIAPAATSAIDSISASDGA